jgi:hypothetical protein
VSREAVRSRPGIRWAARIVLVAVSLLLGVGAGELFLRVFAPQPLLEVPPSFQALPGDQHYQLLPDLDIRVHTLDGGYSIRTSPGGNRGRDPDGPPRPGTTRIVFCGDSFCFGNGVEGDETIPFRTEVRLREKEGEGRYEVFNIGQPGYSLPQTAARLEAWLDEWGGADEVVLLLFAGNDFHDGHPDDLATLWVDENGQVRGDAPSREAKPWTRWSLQTRGWLWRHSMLYSLFRRSIAGFREPPADPALLYRVGLPTGDEVLTGVVASSLGRMAAACRSHHARLTVAVLPAHMQADDGWWEGFAARFEGSTPGTYDRWAPQAWVAGVCDSLGVRCFDLAPVVLEEGGDSFLRTDRHLTPAAGDRVAGALVRDLRP